MIEVAPNLWVGSDADYENLDWTGDFAVCHSAKEPHHRRALGYSGRGAPKDHPEYLFAERAEGKALMLNLVDVHEPEWIRPEIIDKALEWIAAHREAGRRVLVHCNQGGSRAPVIAMLALAKTLPAKFTDAEAQFLDVYPYYCPANGMRQYAMDNWTRYRNGTTSDGKRANDQHAAPC